MPWYVNVLIATAALVIFTFASEWFIDHYSVYFNPNMDSKSRKEIVDKLMWMCFICFLLGIWVEQTFPG